LRSSQAEKTDSEKKDFELGFRPTEFELGYRQDSDPKKDLSNLGTAETDAGDFFHNLHGIPFKVTFDKLRPSNQTILSSTNCLIRFFTKKNFLLCQSYEFY
jgi:hypothetical protein